MNTKFNPPSEPSWPSVGIRRTDFRPHFDGDLVNLFSVITPLSSQKETETFLLDATREIANWVNAHKEQFGNSDKFQIILGWPETIRSSGRQIIKTGGSYSDLDLISKRQKDIPFFSGWSTGIHFQNTEQGAAANP
jgi:hypothetical protein